MSQIGRNDPCSCGSGKKFKKCCLDGTQGHRSVLITKEIQEILDRENDRFRSIMGRNIQGDDPLLPGTVQMSEETYVENVCMIMEEVGFPPAHIYAFRKLGYSVVEGVTVNFSEEEVADYYEAVDEYKMIESGELEVSPGAVEILLGELQKHFKRLKFLYALIIRKYSLSGVTIKLSGAVRAEDYILFCLTKNLKTLEAISVLLENHHGEDAMNLVRSNYENYLEVVCAKNSRENLLKTLRFREGLLKGTHQFKKGAIVDLKTGERVVPLNRRDKARLNPSFSANDEAIYAYLYDHLSSFTHPDLRTAGYYIIDDLGFSHLARNMSNDALIILLVLNLMILQEIRILRCFATSREDIEALASDLSKSLKALFGEEGVHIHIAVKERVVEIAKSFGVP